MMFLWIFICRPKEICIFPHPLASPCRAPIEPHGLNFSGQTRRKRAMLNAADKRRLLQRGCCPWRSPNSNEECPGGSKQIRQTIQWSTDHTYTHTHIHTCTHTKRRMHAYIHTHTSTKTHPHTHTQMHACGIAALGSPRGINFRCTHFALELQKGTDFEFASSPQHKLR